jgi:hypothetical protein
LLDSRDFAVKLLLETVIDVMKKHIKCKKEQDIFMKEVQNNFLERVKLANKLLK